MYVSCFSKITKFHRLLVDHLNSRECLKSTRKVSLSLGLPVAGLRISSRTLFSLSLWFTSMFCLLKLGLVSQPHPCHHPSLPLRFLFRYFIICFLFYCF